MQNSLTKLITRLKPYLRKYLQQHGVDFTRNSMFSCINPEHEDRNPSCGLVGKADDKVFHCFSCGANGDIFTAAYLLEDKPLFGTEFVLDNVFYLADLFKIDRSDIEIDEKISLRAQMYSATNKVAHYILGQDPTTHVCDFLRSRHIEEDTYINCDIGFVPNVREYEQFIKSFGKEALAVMKMAGLDDKALFNKNNVIFVVRDENKRPVGFAARDTTYEEGENKPKFRNSTSRGDIDIYQKSKRLFLLNRATPGLEKIYIFEGYFDACVGFLNGVNCAAVGGLYFNNDQLHVLSDLGYKNVTLVFDGDQAGLDKTYKLIDELLSQPIPIDIRLAFMPEGYDPDDYILEGNDLKALDQKLPFEWRLESLMAMGEDVTPESICHQMIPYVASGLSHLHRMERLRILSLNTGIEQKDLKRELDSFMHARELQTSSLIVDMVHQLSRDVAKSPADAEMLLSKAVDSIQVLKDDSSDTAVSIEEYRRFIDDMRMTEDKQDPNKPPGLKFASYENMQHALMGRMQSRLILVGGAPNAGKTSFMCNLVSELLEAPDSKVSILFHTLDDNRYEIFHRLLSIYASDVYPGATINKMCSPAYYIPAEPQLIEARNFAYDKLMEYAYGNRLLIKDVDHGRTPTYTFNMVKRLQDLTGGEVIVFCDNVYNYASQAEKDKRVKHSNIASYVKAHTISSGCTFFGTVQYTKGSGQFFRGDRKSSFDKHRISNPNELISETIDYEYLADAIIHIFNENHYEMDMDKVVYDEDDEIIYPVKAIFSKNKISSVKGASAHFDFYPQTATFEARR